MLINNKGEVVTINRKFNSKDNPEMFVPLRELKEPQSHKHHVGFSMEQRATFKQ